MSDVIQNGDAVAAAAAAATPSGTLFLKGLIFMGVAIVCTAVSSKFMLEATRAAAIEGVETAKLMSA